VPEKKERKKKRVPIELQSPLNKVGPRTVPWGTPENISEGVK
jgi:hypothetical protein